MGLGPYFGMICGAGIQFLRKLFHVLFGIARAKDAFVVENLELLDGSNKWNLCFFLEKRMIGKWMLCFIFSGVALSHCEKK